MVEPVDIKPRLRVVPLPAAEEFTPTEAVVTQLERLLERARAGRIRAIAYALVEHQDADDDCPTPGWTWGCGHATGGGWQTTNTLGLGVAVLHHDFIQKEFIERAVVTNPLVPPSA